MHRGEQRMQDTFAGSTNFKPPCPFWFIEHIVARPYRGHGRRFAAVPGNKRFRSFEDFFGEVSAFGK
jgi:hypothetical protein